MTTRGKDECGSSGAGHEPRRASAITPLPIPTGAAEAPGLVVIFGGTFDPVHVGHVELARRARARLEASGRARGAGSAWLLFVPAARSPHKAAGPAASDADRAAMLRLALGSVERAAVWTDEVDRASAARSAGVEPAPSYSVDTLRRARTWLDERGLAGTGLCLLIGADQAASFHSWRSPREIMHLARPAVLIRGELHDTEALMRRLHAAGYWSAGELEDWRESVVSVGSIDASSTALREKLGKGDVHSAGALLNPDVAAYIKDHRLYGPEAPDRA